jgi:hypothetical protein
VIITLFFEKNANFFAENWQKSQKIMIITSTPGNTYTSFFLRIKINTKAGYNQDTRVADDWVGYQLLRGDQITDIATFFSRNG